MTLKRVNGQIEVFRHYFELLRTDYKITMVAQDALILQSRSHNPEPTKGKSIALTLMAITHGDEVYGLKVLNRVLEYISTGLIKPTKPIAFILGNVPAAQTGERFLEQDLNRSFNTTASQAGESQRAKVLTQLLRDTFYLLDFHQTREPTETPFFIFPYTEQNLKFARNLLPEIPIVTHWGGGFSRLGMCTDEFVISQNGIGITLEAGQKGFDPTQEALGVTAAVNALMVAETLDQSTDNEKAIKRDLEEGPLYRIIKSQKVCHEGLRLDSGWTNFQNIQKGDKLGRQNNTDKRAEHSGKILFPKYSIKIPKKSEPHPEMYTIIQEIDKNLLPD